MSIKKWPKQQRPRERLMHQGAQSLTDAELLAIFLRTGVKGKTAVELADDLLQQFGSLRGLLRAPYKVFCAAHGLGDAKYVQLQAVLEMSRRHLKETLKRSDAIKSPQAVINFLSLQLKGEQHEIFACLWLDNQHRVLKFERLFRGSITSSNVYPREVVKSALKFNAAAVVFAHNHPSGNSEPSQADIEITKKLFKVLSLVEVRVLDHIIIGEKEHVSFAERGLLEQMQGISH